MIRQEIPSRSRACGRVPDSQARHRAEFARRSPPGSTVGYREMAPGNQTTNLEQERRERRFERQLRLDRRSKPEEHQSACEQARHSPAGNGWRSSENLIGGQLGARPPPHACIASRRCVQRCAPARRTGNSTPLQVGPINPPACRSVGLSRTQSADPNAIAPGAHPYTEHGGQHGQGGRGRSGSPAGIAGRLRPRLLPGRRKSHVFVDGWKPSIGRHELRSQRDLDSSLVRAWAAETELKHNYR